MLASHYRALATALALAVLMPTIASASCQPGKMTYGDIDAVRFTRQGCGANPSPKPTMRCSTYWLFFANFEQHVQYDQLSDDLAPGDYRVSGTFDDAVAILKRHDFFNLVPQDGSPPATIASAVTVLRCNIVTRLAGFPIAGEHPAVLALFNDFEAYATTAKRTRLGAPLPRFPYSTFDDWPSAQ